MILVVSTSNAALEVSDIWIHSFFRVNETTHPHGLAYQTDVTRTFDESPEDEKDPRECLEEGGVKRVPATDSVLRREVLNGSRPQIVS